MYKAALVLAVALAPASAFVPSPRAIVSKTAVYSTEVLPDLPTLTEEEYEAKRKEYLDFVKKEYKKFWESNRYTCEITGKTYEGGNEGIAQYEKDLNSCAEEIEKIIGITEDFDIFKDVEPLCDRLAKATVRSTYTKQLQLLEAWEATERKCDAKWEEIYPGRNPSSMPPRENRPDWVNERIDAMDSNDQYHYLSQMKAYCQACIDENK